MGIFRARVFSYNSNTVVTKNVLSEVDSSRNEDYYDYKPVIYEG